MALESTAGGVHDTYDLVEALGSTQAGRAHTDDENINVAVLFCIVSNHSLKLELREGDDTYTSTIATTFANVGR